ncbi:hypothetical protein K7W42_18120 [Deinococcus sp. HMF7604]|uniref:hypothetical protein n=1 Tax=Deinococcus betulae TaxID=2873312 RepID=UPI001CCB52F7|nr:hypothetical protein [Deinococcus betulae]MBZ9752761.1 hypothetical protein [Deinococcus betulae]
MTSPKTGWAYDRHEAVLSDIALEIVASDKTPICLVVRGSLAEVEGEALSVQALGLECVVSFALSREEAVLLGRALLREGGAA